MITSVTNRAWTTIQLQNFMLYDSAKNFTSILGWVLIAYSFNKNCLGANYAILSVSLSSLNLVGYGKAETGDISTKI